MLTAASASDGSVVVTVVVRGTGGNTALGKLHPMGKVRLATLTLAPPGPG